MDEGKLLIVEDETKIADALKQGLVENGFEIDTAYDGNIGLKLFELNHYNLIVLDINLPGHKRLRIM